MSIPKDRFCVTYVPNASDSNMTPRKLEFWCSLEWPEWEAVGRNAQWAVDAANKEGGRILKVERVLT